MDTIGYIINRNFVLIAVDANYQIQSGKVSLHMDNMRKIYKLNDQNIISVLGNPYRSTDIIKYVMKLNELGHNGTFSRIIEDLKDAFNNSQENVIEKIHELSKILPRFQDQNGYLKMDELSSYLIGKGESIDILTETINTIQNSMPTLAQIMVFGWNKESKMRMVHYASLGQELIGDEFIFSEDLLYIRLLSSSIPIEETVKLENELISSFASHLTPGWDSQIPKISDIIKLGKDILTDGLKRISPYETPVNIVFYELSHQTGYRFNEPDVKLVNLQVNR